MNTNNSTTGNSAAGTATASTTKGSTARGGLRAGEHVVAVQFAAWGRQATSVKASSGGGRGGAAYVVVHVGACLTYAYDKAAIASLLCTVRAPACCGGLRGRLAPGTMGS